MDSPKRVLIDCDGVLCDSLPTWLQEYRAISGDPIQQADLRTYGFGDYVTKPHLLWHALESGEVFRRSAPMMGATQGFRWLCEHNDVYVVTYIHAAATTGHQQRLDWFQHYFPWFDRDRVVFTRNKAVVSGDYIIEDAPANLDAWLSAHPEGRAYIINHQYNRDYSHPRCTRVNSISEVQL